MKPAEVRKFLVAVATGLSQALALGLLPSPYDKYAMLCLAVLGSYGVWRMPNEAPAA